MINGVTEVGDLVEVASMIEGVPAQRGEVLAINDDLITIRWESGEQATFVPLSGTVTVVEGNGNRTSSSPNDTEETAGRRRERFSRGGRFRAKVTILATASVLVGIVVIAFVAMPRSDKGNQTAATTRTTGSATGSLCISWPASISGQPPALRAPNPPSGAYAWSGFDGWHLRIVGLTDVSGSVLGDGKLDARAVPAGPGSVTAQANVIQFSFPGQAASTGMDFTVQCDTSTLLFHLNSTKGPLPLEQIQTGAQGLRPLENPFKVTRAGR